MENNEQSETVFGQSGGHCFSPGCKRAKFLND